MRPALDARTPNMARVYACLLGGKDHYAADRVQARRLLAIYPLLAAMARENRDFQARAITWAARTGISQFLDLGAGLPAAPNTHRVARATCPAAAVAYIDTDPVVVAHARALLAGDGVAAVAADLQDPAAVLADPGLRAVIDPAFPREACTFRLQHARPGRCECRTPARRPEIGCTSARLRRSG
jgi:S-adenosyl methyltransferase